MPESRDPKRARAAKPAARKTTKKAATKKTVARKTITRKPTRRTTGETTRRAPRRPAKPPEDRAELEALAEGDTPEPQPETSRPVAIGSGAAPLASGSPWGGDDTGLPPSPFDEGSAEQPPVGALDGPSDLEIEDPKTENLVGLAAIVLAVSTFLPWYRSRSFAGAEISGWSSGTWGPIVFFLALGALAIIVLRRLRIPMAFPVPYSLMLEGAGWGAVAGLLFKRFFQPDGFAVVGFSLNPSSGGFWWALIAGVALALLGSRLSKDTPIVMLPGWFRSDGGKAGAAVIGLSLIAGVAFGFINDAGTGGNGSLLGSDPSQPQLQTGLPECINDIGFPVPDGVQPTQGFGRTEPDPVCTAIFTSNLELEQLDEAFRVAMKDAGWKFEKLDGAAGGEDLSRVYRLTGPQCGTINILNVTDTRNATVIVGPSFCVDLSGVPQPNRSR